MVDSHHRQSEDGHKDKDYYRISRRYRISLGVESGIEELSYQKIGRTGVAENIGSRSALGKHVNAELVELHDETHDKHRQKRSEQQRQDNFEKDVFFVRSVDYRRFIVILRNRFQVSECDYVK